MLRVGPYVFKRADTEEEYHQIHRLNHRTFVGEIPQHPDPGNGVLVDKFHQKNTYLVVLREGRVIGMVSVHDQPPFSVAERLPDPAVLERPGHRPLEVRLLALEPDKRNSTLFFGLIWCLYDYALEHGHTHLYISGLNERVPLYKQFGFAQLGPPIPCGKATFVPMVLTLGQLPDRIRRMKEQWENRLAKESRETKMESRGSKNEVQSSILHPPSSLLHSSLPHAPICLLPGPVTTAPAVQAAFHEPPIYHRGPEFIHLFQKVRRTLGKLTGGRDVAMLNGSGTLANETVAAALAADPRGGRGIMLVNGEFSQRLAVQAARFGLQPRILTWAWGQPWDLDEIEAALAKEAQAGWIWGVHQESSTGVLNDLPGLVALARDHGVRVCVDCISSLGAVPLDLSEVHLATGASGKSFGSYAGVAIVFAKAAELNHLDMSRIPSYFDIPAALKTEGPRYTFPSPTLRALEAALSIYTSPEEAHLCYDGYQKLGEYVRAQLRRLGLEPLAADHCASPVVTTFAPPGEGTSAEFVARCRSWGFSIGGQSGYLAEKRLVQIATMGAVSRQDVAPLFARLSHWLEQVPELAVS